MPFVSITFLFAYLPAVLLVFWFCRKQPLIALVLLIANLFFYGWGQGRWIVILLFSIAANYLLGIWIQRSRCGITGRIALATAVALNLAPLVILKYSGFILVNLNNFLQVLGGPTLRSPGFVSFPPAGVSFFTFMALSYVISVHRGETKAQRDPLQLGLYISMFPLVMAGPICRYRDLAPQLTQFKITGNDFAGGVRRFVFGLSKKALIADALAVPANAIFAASASDLSTDVAWFGLVCYTLQIYFDFCGYSDMAIGLGRMLGLRFMENFDYPYAASSLRMFWSRWHISLSTWFRDYFFLRIAYPASRLFETLRISRMLNDFAAYAVASLTTMLLIGLWHGAKWTFIAWGLYHGIFLVLERTRLGKRLSRLPAALQHLYLIGAVMGGWVLFRADTFPQAGSFATAMLGIGRKSGFGTRLAYYTNTHVVLALIVGIILSTKLVPYVRYFFEKQFESGTTPSLVMKGSISVFEIVLFAVLLLFSGLSLAGGTFNPFIYFRF